MMCIQQALKKYELVKSVSQKFNDIIFVEREGENIVDS